jgi:hypothetical protein
MEFVQFICPAAFATLHCVSNEVLARIVVPGLRLSSLRVPGLSSALHHQKWRKAFFIDDTDEDTAGCRFLSLSRSKGLQDCKKTCAALCVFT